ncbi:collagen alpha-1(I) chain-like [Pyrgilauda ruficollis]|uniref:collagen alpha-1(I) chain-like n=1 Tax=Pyrgilauda ruficollis TaxID=221976 RepID=UPI001B8613BC|nr:collagen alpha-1(I) chain-like [Pyrgilauda ruficollis]
MLPGALPIHLSSETRHPAAPVTRSLRGRALCAGLCSPRCHRRGRRQRHRPLLPPQPPGAEKRCRGARAGAGTGGAASPRGSRGRWGTLRVPARRAARVRRGCRCRRARRTPGDFGRAGEALPVSRGAVEALSPPRRGRASLPGRFSPSPRPLRAAARCVPPVWSVPAPAGTLLAAPGQTPARANILRGRCCRDRGSSAGDAWAARSCPVIPAGGAQRRAVRGRAPLPGRGKALHLPLKLCDGDAGDADSFLSERGVAPRPRPGGAVRAPGKAEHGSRSLPPRGCSQVPLVPCPGEERRVPPPALPPLPRCAPLGQRSALPPAVPLPRCTSHRCGTPATHTRLLLSGHRQSAGYARAARRPPGEGGNSRGGSGPALQCGPTAAEVATRERCSGSGPPAPAAPRPAFFVNGTLKERAMTSPPGPMEERAPSGGRRGDWLAGARGRPRRRRRRQV